MPSNEDPINSEYAEYPLLHVCNLKARLVANMTHTEDRGIDEFMAPSDVANVWTHTVTV